MGGLTALQLVSRYPADVRAGPVRANGLEAGKRFVIDNFSLLLSHGLLALLCWRLLWRPDLDKEPPAGDPPAPAEAEPADPHARWKRPVRPGRTEPRGDA